MFRFPNIIESQGENENVVGKTIFDKKEESVNKNDIETIYTSIEDPINMDKTVSNERNLVSEIPIIISEKNIITTPVQRKN